MSLIELSGVSKIYRLPRKQLHALSDITLSIPQGQIMAIAGESGSGKSTLGKLLLSIEQPSSGSIYFKEEPFHTMTRKRQHTLRKQLQMVFQDPFTALNPRMMVQQIIGEGIEIHSLCSKAEKKERIDQLLLEVGLTPSYRHRYPHELSGGQQQRVGIARAFALEPEFIVLDEPLSALDAATQRQIIDLMLRLKAEKNITYLFISHDLHVIRQIADYVVILYQGRIVEQAPKEQLFQNPTHPYTKTLSRGLCPLEPPPGGIAPWTPTKRPKALWTPFS